MIKPLQSITLKNDNGEDTTYVVASAPAIVETTEPADVASFSDGAEGIPVKSLLADINPVQSGSGDPSPSNVRTITGWTGMNVYRTGANLWSKSYGRDNPTYLKAGTTLYIKSDMGGFSLWGRKTDGTAYEIQVISANTKSSVTLAYDIVALVVAQGAYDNLVNGGYDLMVSLADFTDIVTGDLSYVPISWEDEAGTIYGGTLDVTTGLLTVTHGIVEYDGSADESWTKGGGANECYIRNDAVKRFLDYRGQLFCDKLATYWHHATFVAQYGISAYGANDSYPSQNWLYVHLTDTTLTVADLKTWLQSNPITVCYPLATPQTYQLTPQAVMTILGQNNIWADTGDVEVSYVADTKLYIDKVIAAL